MNVLPLLTLACLPFASAFGGTGSAYTECDFFKQQCMEHEYCSSALQNEEADGQATYEAFALVDPYAAALWSNVGCHCAGSMEACSICFEVISACMEDDSSPRRKLEHSWEGEDTFMNNSPLNLSGEGCQAVTLGFLGCGWQDSEKESEMCVDSLIGGVGETATGRDHLHWFMNMGCSCLALEPACDCVADNCIGWDREDVHFEESTRRQLQAQSATVAKIVRNPKMLALLKEKFQKK